MVRQTGWGDHMTSHAISDPNRHREEGRQARLSHRHRTISDRNGQREVGGRLDYHMKSGAISDPNRQKESG